MKITLFGVGHTADSIDTISITADMETAQRDADLCNGYIAPSSDEPRVKVFHFKGEVDLTTGTVLR